MTYYQEPQEYDKTEVNYICEYQPGFYMWPAINGLSTSICCGEFVHPTVKAKWQKVPKTKVPKEWLDQFRQHLK